MGMTRMGKSMKTRGSGDPIDEVPLRMVLIPITMMSGARNKSLRAAYVTEPLGGTSRRTCHQVSDGHLISTL